MQNNVYRSTQFPYGVGIICLKGQVTGTVPYNCVRSVQGKAPPTAALAKRIIYGAFSISELAILIPEGSPRYLGSPYLTKVVLQILFP